MMKHEVLDWNSFFRGDVIPKSPKVGRFTSISLVVPAIPTVAAHATGGEAWMKILSTMWEISDWLCVGVIMFAGTVWMFGNRTKAMELLIGSSSGYLIIKHAKQIQEWLSQI